MARSFSSGQETFHAFRVYIAPLLLYKMDRTSSPSKKEESFLPLDRLVEVYRCKDGLSPGFPAAPERDVYDHSALPVFPRRFRTFRTRFPKVPAEGKLRQVCRSFVSLIHMFPCCFLVRIWLLDLGFMFLVCLLTSSLGLRRFYVLDLVISPAVGSRHPHVCSMVK